MKLNNKGFAITGFLYSIFAIFLVILSLIMISMTGSKLTLDKIKKDVKNNLDDPSGENNLYEKLFSYNGTFQNFTVPYSGWYKIELWGAAGNENMAKGSYVSGKIYLKKSETLSVYVGGSGVSSIEESAAGGYNGGGNALGTIDGNNGSGGGATDIRINGNNLNDRIMVAGGGGGTAQVTENVDYGDGGALFSNDSADILPDNTVNIAYGASQLLGGYGNIQSVSGNFGIGADGMPTNQVGGGGGYYGGGVTNYKSSGGSSFISGYAGVNAITSSESLTPTNNTIHYSGKYFIDGKMIAGNNSGNGKAKITYLSETKPNRINNKLNNVRYIKDCAEGSSYSGHVGWVELQAIKDGINVAKGKKVEGTEVDVVNGIYDKVVDGDITTDNYDGTSSSTGTYCITVDLGQNYDLDEIAVWHYWGDGRTYYSNVISVSKNNSEWQQVIGSEEPETSNGKRVSAYSN